MKTRFILNPRSGRSRGASALSTAIRAFIANHDLDATFVVSESHGHVAALARAAIQDGCDRIVAVGGDGTMNEAGQAVVNTRACLALVPCGSGNGLALHLGIPTRLGSALALLADPTARIAAIDSGTANGHPFFNVMGLGFDAEISHRFNSLPQRGPAAYARAGMAAFMRHRPEPVVLSDGTGPETTLDAFVVSVANSDQYGNRARLAPGARVDDGMLDLVAVKPIGFLGALPLVIRLFRGTFDRSSRVRRMRGAHFTIERRAPGLIHTDGEDHETGAVVRVDVHPRSLRLVVPSTCCVPSEPASADPETPWTRTGSASAR